MSGSVMIVAGFELTRTTSYPSSRSALHAWGPEESDSLAWPVAVGLVRGRVGVDQAPPVPPFPQRLARLGARVVELARLADDDRAGANDQDLVDVGSLGHVGALGTVGDGARGGPG